ncbi:MAG: glutathione S-transferase family protein [Parvibaculum sp.]|uniref:glutathione S-transferase family protein n=1 Tax=Parvibaculum sp. TaxID=2024848 RepID=UPI0032EF0A75
MSNNPPVIELHQFPYSHYNEKARWALDYKGLPHRRIGYLPGPHAPAITKLSGATQTPVLRIGGTIVPGSAAIVEALETAHPAPALYPADPAQRKAALDLQAHFDAEIGPCVRRALFSELVLAPGYIARVFSTGKPLPARLFYRAVTPLALGTIRRSMEIDRPGAVEASYKTMQAALDLVAAQAGPTGYLVGDRFSIADLTAAALLAPACDAPHVDMKLPSPRPPRIDAWLSRWAAHPGTAWVQGIYRKHRPARAEPAG